MINRSFKWIARHQVIAFFIFTFLITWGLGFSYRAVMERKFLMLPLMFLATCGPALAGIIITILTGSGQPSGKRRTAWIVFFITWIAATLVFFTHHIVINRAPVSPATIRLVLISILPIAFIVNLTYTSFPIVRSSQRSHVGKVTKGSSCSISGDLTLREILIGKPTLPPRWDTGYFPFLMVSGVASLHLSWRAEQCSVPTKKTRADTGACPYKKSKALAPY